MAVFSEEYIVNTLWLIYVFFTLTPSYVDKLLYCSAGLVYYYLLLKYTYMTCLHIYYKYIVQGCTKIPYHIKWQSPQHYLCF